MKKMTTQTVKNDSEFYRADLSHTVSTLGAALRSLERMGNHEYAERVDIMLYHLSEELKEIRTREREAK